jgi:hypothetical protein
LAKRIATTLLKRKAKLLVAPLLLLSATSFAGTVEWSGSVSEYWADSSNWTPGAPTVGDDVKIAGGYQVSVNSLGNQIGSLETGTASDLEISTAGQLSVTSGLYNSVQGNIENNGLLQFTGSVDSGGVVINHGELEILNELILFSGGLNFSNSGVANLGYFGSGGIVENSGQFVADVAEIYGTLSNTGSIIGDISGSGTVDNSGTILSDSFFIDTVHNRGRITVGLELEVHSLTNHNQISTNSFRSLGEVVNHGELIIGHVSSYPTSWNNTGLLKISVTLSQENITNSGDFELGNAGWIYDLDNSGTFTIIDSANLVYVDNTGTIQVLGNVIIEEFDNSNGTIINSGELGLYDSLLEGTLINTGTVQQWSSGDLTIRGSVFGGGTYEGFTNVTFDEMLDIGSEELIGDVFTFTDSNLFLLDVLNNGDTGRSSANSLRLGGTLRLDISEYLDLAEGDIFNIFSAGEILGGFSSLQFSLANTGLMLQSNKYFSDNLWHYQLTAIRDVSTPGSVILFAFGMFLLRYRRAYT